MQKIVLFFLGICCLQVVQAQRNLTGTWQGKLTVATTSLRLVIHIKGAEGEYSATLDSPDQGAKGIPVSRVRVTGDSLVMEVAAAGAKLSGQLTSDSTFSGQWVQGMSLPLDLKKLPAGEVVAEAKRPQTPKPPFPYLSNDVTYFNKDRSIQYGATLTKPEGKGPFPALVLLTGSGPQNRDEELFSHKPFAVIADYLTRRGYLVLRADDRGVGKTTGNRDAATSKDFADDAMAGLNYLKTLPDADKTKLGLLGHSEGGMLAQLVAAQRSDVAFVILMAAPGEKVIDLMLHQNEAILQSAGVASENIQHYLALYKPLALALSSPLTNTAEKKTAGVLVDNWLTQTPKDAVLATTGIRDEKSKEAFIDAFSKSVSTPWFRYFFHYDPDPYVRKIKAKVLALNGDRDVQVVAKPNLAALKTSLLKGRAKKFDVVELKGLNHLFQRCTSCTVTEYGQLEETIAPEALEVIGSWLEKNVK